MDYKINQNVINDYENYLVKNGFHLEDILNDIKSIKNIEILDNLATSHLNKLENLNLEYKLYDCHYEEFIVSMGKFALAINTCSPLEISSTDKELFIIDFLKLHNRFESLSQQNIMKDAYVWK